MNATSQQSKKKIIAEPLKKIIAEVSPFPIIVFPKPVKSTGY